MMFNFKIKTQITASAKYQPNDILYINTVQAILQRKHLIKISMLLLKDKNNRHCLKSTVL